MDLSIEIVNRYGANMVWVNGVNELSEEDQHKILNVVRPILSRSINKRSKSSVYGAPNNP